MTRAKVEFTYVSRAGAGRPENREGEVDDMFVPLSLYRSTTVEVREGDTITYERRGPWASISTPFEGDLNEDELERLEDNEFNPIHAHWRFKVTRMGGKD